MCFNQDLGGFQNLRGLFGNATMKKTLLLLSIVWANLLHAQTNTAGFSLVPQPAKKQIDVLYNGKLMTSYCYYDSIAKPFLYPLNTVDGITVSRGYPLKPVAGDRTDHPHHTGMWMNYESVNGLDFWNNSTAIAADKKMNYGTIKHDKVLAQKAEKDKASLSVSANWIRPDGHVLLKEKTDYVFSVKGSQFFIDRITSLTAADTTVVFKDAKDGFLGIRVARVLEMPSKEPGVFIDAHGIETKVPVDNNGVTGLYTNSDGVTGDAVWSTKGPWCMLTGTKDGKAITIAIFDHPSNVGYPTYWHARGYGLFAANPLGRKVFSNGKEELNYSLKPGASTTFHYKVLIQSGAKGTSEEMNEISKAFVTNK